MPVLRPDAGQSERPELATASVAEPRLVVPSTSHGRGPDAVRRSATGSRGAVAPAPDGSRYHASDRRACVLPPAIRRARYVRGSVLLLGCTSLPRCEIGGHPRERARPALRV